MLQAVSEVRNSDENQTIRLAFGDGNPSPQLIKLVRQTVPQRAFRSQFIKQLFSFANGLF